MSITGTTYRRVMRAIRVIVAALLLAGCSQTVVHPAAVAAAPVTTRTVAMARGRNRPLPVTLWYRHTLVGRRPIVLFSHGFRGLPRQFSRIATGWAEAGYVVAAPAYPFTNGHVKDPTHADIPNQSIDAEYVLGRVRAFDRTPGDPLAGHLATDDVAVIGFSAGAQTTLGMLVAHHDPDIRAAVSIAGRKPIKPFGGAPVPVLFIHGDHDRTVPFAAGRLAYRTLPWTKTWLTVPGEGHGQYLQPGDPGYPLVSSAILAFLKAHLG
jgi:dienelactone hydrolase